MGGRNQQLLTDDDRRAYLHELLGHRLKSTERLQLPTLESYNFISTDSGLKTVAYEMCRQIGFKPGGLKVQYASKPLLAGYVVDQDTKTILIDPQLSRHVYSCGAVLAMAVVTYAVEHFSHQKADRPFIEFVTIETGLGLWIINALRPRISLRQKLYHIIDTSWFHKEGILMEAYSQRQYVERVVSFAHENHIDVDSYLPHVLERVRYLFPSFTLNQSHRYLPEAPSALVHKKAANQLWVKVILIVLIAASGIVFGVYALVSRQAPVNPEIERLHRQVNKLKKSYEDCQQEVSKQQSTYDPNDLFMTRQIDDTKSRCESLRNKYNYTLDQYQILVEK
jgi:hypothetical protein